MKSKRPLLTEDLQLSSSELNQLLTELYELSESKFIIEGQRYTIVHVTDGYALLDEAEETTIPYWAEVWPSSVALAEVLEKSVDLRGKRVIELGAGLGLGSCVAAKRGARVVATDYLVEPLAFAKVNGSRNSVVIEPRLLDWTSPRDDEEEFDLVLAADLLYSESNVEPVSKILVELLKPGGIALLSDPQRNHLPEFLSLMDRHGCYSKRIERSVEFSGRQVMVDLYLFSLEQRVLRL